MGGFPSHDAAGFIFTTAVQPPHAVSSTGVPGSNASASGAAITTPTGSVTGMPVQSPTSASGGSAGNRSTGTFAHAPGTGPVEICLIPLFRRYFNDSNKKLKEAVSNLYINRGANAGSPANAARAPMPPMSAPVWMPLHGTGSGGHESPMPYHRDGGRAMLYTLEHLLGDIETSFYANGGNVLQAEPLAHAKADSIKMARERKRNELNEALFSIGWGAKLASDDSETAGGVVGKEEGQRETGVTSGMIAPHDVDSPIPRTALGGDEAEPSEVKKNNVTAAAAAAADPVVSSGRAAELKSSPVLRPVPCAVCIIEPEGGGRGRSTNHHVHNTPLLVNGVPISDWVNVQGRKVHCIGYVSCFATQSDAYAMPSTTSPSSPDDLASAPPFMPRYYSTPETGSPREFTGVSAQNSAGANSGGGGTTSAATPQQHRIVDVDEKGLNVYLELHLEHEESFSYMIEPIMLLASMAFRSQFLTCSMWQQSFWSKAVEDAYYHHLQLLNVHVRIRKTQYARLKALYQQFPLMEQIEELGFGDHCLACQSGGHQHGDTDVNPASDGGASAHGKDPADEDECDVENSGHCVHDKNVSDTVFSDTAAPEEPADADAPVPFPVTGEEEDGEACAREGNSLTAERAAETSSTVNSPVVSGRRCRSHRNRRRPRRVRLTLERDDVYRQNAVVLPVFRLYKDDSQIAHGGTSGSVARPAVSSGDVPSPLPMQDRSESTTPVAESEDSDRCTVEDADGIEVSFEGGILARLTKFVAETASYETVKGNYVRCDMGPLMKERRHLMAAHREARQEYLDYQEEEERLFGSEKVLTALQQWLKEGKQMEEQRRMMPDAAKAVSSAAVPMGVGATGVTIGGVPGVPQTNVGAAVASGAGAGTPMMMYVPGLGLVNVVVPNSTGAQPLHTGHATPMMMMPQPQQYFVGPNGQLMMAMPTAPPVSAPAGLYAAHPPTTVMPQASVSSTPQGGTSTRNSSRPSTPTQQPQTPPSMPSVVAQQPQLQAIYPQQLPQQQHIFQLPQPVAQPQRPQSYMYATGPGGQLMMIPVTAPTANVQLLPQTSAGVATMRLPSGVPAGYAAMPVPAQSFPQSLQMQQQQLLQAYQLQHQRSGIKPTAPQDPVSGGQGGGQKSPVTAGPLPTIKIGGVVLPADGAHKAAPIPQSATAAPPSYGSIPGLVQGGLSPAAQTTRGMMSSGADVSDDGGTRERAKSGNVQDLLAAAIGRRAQGEGAFSTAPATRTSGWSVVPGNDSSGALGCSTGTMTAGGQTASTFTNIVPGLHIGGGGVAQRPSVSTGSSDDYAHQARARSAFFDTEDDAEQAAALEAATAAIRAIEGDDVLFGMPGTEDTESLHSSDDDAASTSQRLNNDFFA